MNWLSLLCSIVPLGWAVQMVRELLLARQLAGKGIEVAGQVVRRRQIRGIGRYYYAPTIRFTTLAGQVVKAESAGHAIGLTFRPGDAVRVRYDPDQPARFLLVQEMGAGSRYARLAIAGLMLALLWWQ